MSFQSGLFSKSLSAVDSEGGLVAVTAPNLPQAPKAQDLSTSSAAQGGVLAPPPLPPGPKLQLAMAMICQSNVNRSMASHHCLMKEGYKHVSSFGVGKKIRMPGESLRSPNEYLFGTPYTNIYEDLRRKNQRRYDSNGMLNMIERDTKVKTAPERFQDTTRAFDLIICFEKRVFEIVVQDIRSRKPASLLTPCHVINLETPDNHEEAHKASQVTIRLVAAIHDVVNNSSKSSSSSSTSTSSSAMSDNRNSLREGKHDSSEGGLDDETLALESMLTTMSAHLPYPDSAAHRAPMYRWSEAMPGLLAQFEEELEKPIDHIVLWV